MPKKKRESQTPQITRSTTPRAGAAGTRTRPLSFEPPSRFNNPVALTSREGWLFVADRGGKSVRKVLVKTGETSTLVKFASVSPVGISILPGASPEDSLLTVTDSTSCRIVTVTIPRSCDGVALSGKRIDKGGVCGGADLCLDCAGVPNGDAVKDRCGECGGDGSSCREAPAQGGRMPIDDVVMGVGRQAKRAVGVEAVPVDGRGKRGDDDDDDDDDNEKEEQEERKRKDDHDDDGDDDDDKKKRKDDHDDDDDDEDKKRKDDDRDDDHDDDHDDDDDDERGKVMGKVSPPASASYPVGVRVDTMIGRDSECAKSRTSDSDPPHDEELTGPMGVVLGHNDHIYIADSGANLIRRVGDGHIKLFAGTGKRGSQDGPGGEATFDKPSGMAVGQNGALLVADSGSGLIRTVSQEGVVGTIRVEGVQLVSPRGVTASRDGTIYVTDAASGKVVKISPSGKAAVAGPEGEALGRPRGVAVDSKGGLIVADLDGRFVACLPPVLPPANAPSCAWMSGQFVPVSPRSLTSKHETIPVLYLDDINRSLHPYFGCASIHLAEPLAAGC
jgi:hypothetical protein